MIPIPSPDPPGPWMTLAEANARLRYKSRWGIYKWLKANPGVILSRRGKVWLVTKRDIDQALERVPARLRTVGKRTA